MNAKDRQIWIPLMALLCAAIMVLAPAWTRIARAELPPRPEDNPAPTPTPERKTGYVGALIELRAQFDPAWSWTDSPWQEMETIVQWQDAFGNWHDVEGWCGGFDEVKEYEGRKSWWMPRGHFGTGPFRWVVYRAQGSESSARGDPLAISEAFYMPRSTGQVARVVVSISQ
jgi:hypothetical protein